MVNRSAKFDNETCNGEVSIVLIRSMHGRTDRRTDTRTEPQNCYYIPSATRCAEIIKLRWAREETRNKQKKAKLKFQIHELSLFSHQVQIHNRTMGLVEEIPLRGWQVENGPANQRLERHKCCNFCQKKKTNMIGYTNFFVYSI